MSSTRRAEDFRLEDWVVSPRLNRLRRGDEARHLEPKAMDLLVFLAERAGEVVSKDDIIEMVWEGRIIAARSRDFDAYQAYLTGLSYLRQPDFWSTESMRIITHSWERAVAIDPEFATAQAALAAILASSYAIGLDARRSACRGREKRSTARWSSIRICRWLTSPAVSITPPGASTTSRSRPSRQPR